MPTTEETQKLRERMLQMLAAGPLTGPELTQKIYPKADISSFDPDHTRVVRQLKRLEDEGKIKRTTGSRLSPWVLRAKPSVNDLPDAAPTGKRVYKKRETNGTSDNALRAFLIRDIRMKLDELERLA